MARFGRSYPMPQIIIRRGSNVLFDAVSNGICSFTTSLSWTHTATAGATVLVDITTNASVTFTAGPTYDGVTMTLVSSQDVNNSAANGTMYRYKVTGVAGGAKTVAMTFSTGVYASAIAASYLNVVTVGSTVGSSGAGNTSMSQVGTCTSGQKLVSGFGVSSSSGNPAVTGVSGGTNRYNGSGVNGGANAELSDASINTTFAATADFLSFGWAALLTILT